MSEITKINEMLNAARGRQGVEMSGLTDSPVFATALVTDILATFGSGNIGRLAVTIIANRLLAAGADPRYLNVTLTIDSDTADETIEAVALGLKDAAVDAEMEWGIAETAVKCPGPPTGIALSVFGTGQKIASVTSELICPRKGDSLIITGPVGATGAAIAGMGQGVEVLTRSDGTVLTDVMRAAYVQEPDISAVYYPLEGIKKALDNIGIEADIDAGAVPVDKPVSAACNVMGLSPLDLMTADAMLLAVSPGDASKVIEAVRRYKAGEVAAIIGKVR